MTTLDDILAVNPAASNHFVVACLGTTRTNEQCGVAAINNAIVRDNNEQQTEKEKEKQQQRDQGTATWKKIQRNVQRGRKIVVADDELEYLARLFLCARHRRRSQLTALVQRIKDNIDSHHQRLAAEKLATRTQEMDFDFSRGLGVIGRSRRARRLEAERNARREETESTSQESTSDNTSRHSGSAEQSPPAEGEVDTSLNPPPPPPPSSQPASPVPRWTMFYNQLPQPASSPVTVISTIFRQPPQPSGRRRRRVARKPIETGDECSICLEELRGDGDGGGELIWCRTQCGNNFHRSCIISWLGTLERQSEQPSATCPACRVLWILEGDWAGLYTAH